jgi:hypothetical protein
LFASVAALHWLLRSIALHPLLSTLDYSIAATMMATDSVRATVAQATAAAAALTTSHVSVGKDSGAGRKLSHVNASEVAASL